MPSRTSTKQRTLVIGAVIFGILFTAFFGIRALRAFTKFGGHRPPPPPGHVETDVELIREWMTIPFIARMYHVPEDIIFETLEISPQENRDKSLEDLNQEYYPSANQIVLEKVKTVVLANQPPPTPVLPDPPVVP